MDQMKDQMESMQKLNDYKLSSDLSGNKKFASLETNEQRIDYILTNVRSLSDFKDSVQTITESHRKLQSKSREVAANLRIRGKGFLETQTPNYAKAIECFTYAILEAPFPSDTSTAVNNELTMAYSLRSLAYFEEEEYELSLSDANKSIDLCKTYPMLLHRLYCLRSLGRTQEACDQLDQLVDTFHTTIDAPTDAIAARQHLMVFRHILVEELDSKSTESSGSSSDTSEEISMANTEDKKSQNKESSDVWMHPNCQLRSSDQKGRYLIAKQEIPKGTVVMAERPFICAPIAMPHMYCANCGHICVQQFTPCRQCREVIFCDDKCRAEADHEFHRYECGIVGALYSLSSPALLAFRVITQFGVQSIADREGADFDLGQHVADIQKHQSLKPSMNDHKDVSAQNKTDSKTKALDVFMALTDNDSSHEPIHDAYHGFIGIQMALIVISSQQQDFDAIRDYHYFVSLAALCVRLIRRVNTNVFGWINRPDMTRIGSCVYTISSLVNHSCAPNLFWQVDSRAKFTAIATKNIGPNEEISISYGPTFWSQPFLDRQQKLKRNYFFDCDCKMCRKEVHHSLALRCRQCCGPVVHNYILRRQKNRCMRCSQPYNNFGRDIQYIRSSLELFDQMMSNYDMDYNKRIALVSCERLVTIIGHSVWTGSQELIDRIRQLVRVYIRLRRWHRAVNFAQLFATQTKGSIEHLEDLYMWTNVYYNYFVANRAPTADSLHGKLAIEYYDKLIDALKEQKLWYESSRAVFIASEDVTDWSSDSTDSADSAEVRPDSVVEAIDRMAKEIQCKQKERQQLARLADKSGRR